MEAMLPLMLKTSLNICVCQMKLRPFWSEPLEYEIDQEEWFSCGVINFLPQDASQLSFVFSFGVSYKILFVQFFFYFLIRNCIEQGHPTPNSQH